jgi:hypothetical protein
MRVLVAGSGRHLVPTAAPTPATAGFTADTSAANSGNASAAAASSAPGDAQLDALLAPLQEAARELGAELARRGHEIWVGSDDPLDIDPYVVEGALKEQAGKVSIKVPRGFPEPYKGRSEVRKEWGEFPDWDVTTMEVIDKVDAVILLGGRLGVLHAGTSAWMMRKVVVPIGSFGGGAETVGRYGSSRRATFYHRGLNDEEIDRLTSPWGPWLNAAAAVASMESVQKAGLRARVDANLWRRVSLLMVALRSDGQLHALIAYHRYHLYAAPQRRHHAAQRGQPVIAPRLALRHLRASRRAKPAAPSMSIASSAR